ncbi:MAG: hypothetical protein LBU32_09420 [Clostridiales bacterium]|jgi:hypothetical protein|nr:hypothetical protein [Clostridiales bacterium]
MALRNSLCGFLSFLFSFGSDEGKCSSLSFKQSCGKAVADGFFQAIECYTDFQRKIPFWSMIIQRVRNDDIDDINRTTQWTVLLQKGTFDENR